MAEGNNNLLNIGQLINLTGLQTFWLNVVKPKFENLSGEISTLNTNLGKKADNSRFESFGTTGKKIEAVIADLQIAANKAGVISITSADGENDLVKVSISGAETEPESGIYQGAITVSIDETALNTKFGTIEDAIETVDGKFVDYATTAYVNGELEKKAGLDAFNTLSGKVNENSEALVSKASTADLNTEKDRIDTIVSDLDGDAGIKAKLATAINDIDKAESDITNLTNNKANQADLEAVEGELSTAKTNITNLTNDKADKSALAVEIGRIDAAATAITNLTNDKADKSALAVETGRIDALEGQVGALVSATHYLGVTTTTLTDGATTAKITVDGKEVTATSGNVVIYGQQEFIWVERPEGGKWQLMGDTTAVDGRITELTGVVKAHMNDKLSDAEITTAFNNGWA